MAVVSAMSGKMVEDVRIMTVLCHSHIKRKIENRIWVMNRFRVVICVLDFIINQIV